MVNTTSCLRYSGSFYSNDQAVEELYSSSYNVGQLRKIWSFLTGKSYSLLSIDIINPDCVENTLEKTGTETVQIDQIRGSESRIYDFDCDFNPLVRCTHDRWLGIASAKRRGRHLPAVVLVQVGDIYFVRDGHHRISVAKALREEVIEAKVIVWQVKGFCPRDYQTTLSTCYISGRFKDLHRAFQPIKCLWKRLIHSIIPGVCNPSFN